VVDPQSAEALALTERGLDVYVMVNHRRFSINAEYVRSNQRDRVGSGGDAVTAGGLIEVAANLATGRVDPYVRFDRTSLPPDGGPYASIRGSTAPTADAACAR